MSTNRRNQTRVRLTGTMCVPASCLLLAMLLSLPSRCCAAEPPRWTVVAPVPASVKVRNLGMTVEQGLPIQRFQFEAAEDFQTVHLQLRQPAAMAFDEFSAAVPVNSNREGVLLSLQLVAPATQDPRTGQPLITSIAGARYERSEQWQTLTVTPDRARLDAKARALRAELRVPQIDMAGAFANACELTIELHRGLSYLDIGAAEYGPVVEPVDPSQVPPPQPVAQQARVRVDRDKVLFEGTPMFPRILPDHGEPAELLSQMNVNTIWVSDLNARARLEQLIARNMVVLATPPHPQFDPADFSAPLEGLPPLEQTAELPDMWYLGTSIRPHQISHLLAWAREIRSADRVLQRPLAADFAGAEDVASRLVDCVGISQNSVVHFRPFGQARNLSYLRQNASAQLTLPWEWIQTEHSPAYTGWRQRTGSTAAFVEPEQILMQVVACLSAGARGVGFWKTRPLSSAVPADAETALAIELAGIYIDIMEPLLLKSTVDGHIPVVTAAPSTATTEREQFLERLLDTTDRNRPDYSKVPLQPDATVFSSSGSSLILAGVWDATSQFVPQAMTVQPATLTVAASETAAAWQISPTGVVGLRRIPAAGGLRLQLDEVDQLAIAFVTSDLSRVQSIQQRVQQHAPRAAELFLQLAEMKLARVTRTSALIEESAAGQTPVKRDELDIAASQLQSARLALQRNDFPRTQQRAASAMRALRRLQSRYWFRAIQSLPAPTASPHTVCFSTLPDHWKMMQSISAAPATAKLLPSGSFDHPSASAENAWKPVSTQPETHYAAAEIARIGSNSALRMRTLRKSTATGEPASDRPALLVQCPEIQVQKGDLLEITARVRLGLGVPTANQTPFLIFDADLGPEMAVAPRLEPSWRTFRVFREASETGPYRIWLALKGSAEVYVDDLQVTRRRSSGGSAVVRPVSQRPAGSRAGSR